MWKCGTILDDSNVVILQAGDWFAEESDWLGRVLAHVLFQFCQRSERR